MNINPGELNKRISIIKVKNEKNENGYPIKTRETVLQCYAKFSRTSGTELVKANADMSEVKVRFLIRYTPLLDRNYIISYAGEDYEINYINDYEDRHEYIEIFASRLAV